MLVKGGYSVEVSDKYRKKVIWEVVDDHLVEGGVEHEEICLLCFSFNLFYERREECVGVDVKELPYWLMLMKSWNGDWEEQIYGINKKVDEENGRGENQENGQFWKLWRFSRNELWNNIGCLLSSPTFVLGGSIL